MNTDFNLTIFKAITNFTNELGSIFSTRQHSLKLYCRLIKHTTISHEKSIQKHINIFRDFCFTNRNAILTKNEREFVRSTISYSDKVFINFSEIFRIADNETKNVIWSHFLIISAFVDPAGGAKAVLKQNAANKNETVGNEDSFLLDIFNKVEQNIGTSTNPMEAVSSIMQNGVFSDLVSSMNNGFQDGSLNIGRLMGTVQTLITSINDDVKNIPGQENSSNDFNMLNSTLSSLMGNLNMQGSSENASAPPNLMGLIGPLMSSFSQNTAPVVVQNNEGFEEEKSSAPVVEHVEDIFE